MRGEQARESIRGILENSIRLSGFYEFAINNPHLSFWNAVQIYSSKPTVTVCKTFDDWHDQDNRRIKQGEHGIVYYSKEEVMQHRKNCTFPKGRKNKDGDIVCFSVLPI